jgi:ketosteroid isomerase-like protein
VPSHRALLDEFYRRMNVQDMALTEMCSPDAEWHWPPSSPETRIFRGRDEILAGLQMWMESWGELHFDVGEVLEDGDWVLAMVSYRMRGAGSGLALEHVVAHLHQLDGDLIKGWWMFGDADRARRRFLEGDRPG